MLIILAIAVTGLAVYFTLPSEKPVEPVVAQEQVQTPVVEEKPVEPAITLEANEILRLVNEERSKVGVKPLVMDNRLNQSAQKKAEQMFSENLYSHVDSNGIRGASYIGEYMKACTYGSENISALNRTSEEAVDAWMESPSHRKAILDTRYEYMGFGNKDTYAVQHFCDVD